jgi:hypothetical protein
MKDKIVVVFVEGQTEVSFYNRICQHFKKNGNAKIKVIIKNIKGVGNYENKAPAILKNQIKSINKNSKIVVFCAYDTDVFDIPFQQKPPVDWKKVESKLLKSGAEIVHHIKAVKMIEDWFLKDMDSLCKFLKLDHVKSIKGKNAFEKMKMLFKKGNKIYQKGYNVSGFVENMDIEKITNSLEEELRELKMTLQ